MATTKPLRLSLLLAQKFAASHLEQICCQVITSVHDESDNNRCGLSETGLEIFKIGSILTRS